MILENTTPFTDFYNWAGYRLVILLSHLNLYNQLNLCHPCSIILAQFFNSSLNSSDGGLLAQ